MRCGCDLEHIFSSHQLSVFGHVCEKYEVFDVLLGSVAFFNDACVLIISIVFYLSQGLTKILRVGMDQRTRNQSHEH